MHKNIGHMLNIIGYGDHLLLLTLLLILYYNINKIYKMPSKTAHDVVDSVMTINPLPSSNDFAYRFTHLPGI